jgi:hypothetical protein
MCHFVLNERLRKKMNLQNKSMFNEKSKVYVSVPIVPYERCAAVVTGFAPGVKLL